MSRQTFGATELNGGPLRALIFFISAIFRDLELEKLKENYLSAIPGLLPASAYEFQLRGFAGKVPLRASPTTANPPVIDYRKVAADGEAGHGHDEPVDDGGTTRFVEAPLTAADCLMGTLTFARHAHEPDFAKPDLEVVRIVAQHTSVAVAHALKYAEMRERWRLAEAAMEELETAVVFSDSAGGTRFSNRRARELLEQIGVDPAFDGHFHEGLRDSLSSLRLSGGCTATSAIQLTQRGRARDSRVVLRSVQASTGLCAATYLYTGRKGTECRNSAPLLSKREIEVLDLIAKGCHNKEIAGTLVVSVNTVKHHMKQLFRKMGVNSRSELVARALSNS